MREDKIELLNALITGVNQSFEIISKRNYSMVLTGTANTDNPQFIALQNQFDSFLKYKDHLLELLQSEINS